MRHTVLSVFLFVAILGLGLGYMGVVKAGELKSNQLKRVSFPYDGVWEGGNKLCGRWHGRAHRSSDTVYLATNLIIKNGQPRFGAKIFVDVGYGTGTGISTLRLPDSHQLTWNLKEIINDSDNYEPLLFWEVTSESTGDAIVKIRFSRPASPTDPIMLKVSGARECDIKLSYNEVE